MQTRIIWCLLVSSVVCVWLGYNWYISCLHTRYFRNTRYILLFIRFSAILYVNNNKELYISVSLIGYVHVYDVWIYSPAVEHSDVTPIWRSSADSGNSCCSYPTHTYTRTVTLIRNKFLFSSLFFICVWLLLFVDHSHNSSSIGCCHTVATSNLGRRKSEKNVRIRILHLLMMTEFAWPPYCSIVLNWPFVVILLCMFACWNSGIKNSSMPVWHVHYRLPFIISVATHKSW